MLGKYRDHAYHEYYEGRCSGFRLVLIYVVKIMWRGCKFTGDPLHSRAACTQPCNVNTHSRAHCSPGARLCEQWGHGCVNNGARLCASARLCRGSPVKLWKILSIHDIFKTLQIIAWIHENVKEITAEQNRYCVSTEVTVWADTYRIHLRYMADICNNVIVHNTVTSSCAMLFNSHLPLVPHICVRELG